MTVKELVGRLVKKIFKVFLWAFLFSNIYLVLCKWMMPPVTLTQLGSLFSGHGLRRDYVSYDEIAPAAKLAAMASEDQLFPVHTGFDWRSLERSVQQKNTRRKRARGAGASTISQQVAKNVILWQGSGIGRYIRKLPEVYYTKMIEWIWGKERILEVYLNVAEMGEGIFGIEAAAQAYFKKPAKNLSRQEAAMIIVCLPSPKRYTVKPMSRWVKMRHPRIMQQMRFIEGDVQVKKLVYGAPAVKK